MKSKLLIFIPILVIILFLATFKWKLFLDLDSGEIHKKYYIENLMIYKGGTEESKISKWSGSKESKGDFLSIASGSSHDGLLLVNYCYRKVFMLIKTLEQSRIEESNMQFITDLILHELKDKREICDVSYRCVDFELALLPYLNRKLENSRALTKEEIRNAWMETVQTDTNKPLQLTGLRLGDFISHAEHEAMPHRVSTL